jgi:hypothetical protein
MKRMAGHPREPKYRLRDSTCQTSIFRSRVVTNVGLQYVHRRQYWSQPMARRVPSCSYSVSITLGNPGMIVNGANHAPLSVAVVS